MIILVSINTMDIAVDGAIGIYQPPEASLLVTPPRPNPLRHIDLVGHFVALHQSQNLQMLNQCTA